VLAGLHTNLYSAVAHSSPILDRGAVPSNSDSISSAAACCASLQYLTLNFAENVKFRMATRPVSYKLRSSDAGCPLLAFSRVGLQLPTSGDRRATILRKLATPERYPVTVGFTTIPHPDRAPPGSEQAFHGKPAELTAQHLGNIGLPDSKQVRGRCPKTMWAPWSFAHSAITGLSTPATLIDRTVPDFPSIENLAIEGRPSKAT